MRCLRIAWIACVVCLAVPASAEVIDVTFKATDGTDLSGSFSYDSAEAPYAWIVTPQGRTAAYDSYDAGFGPVNFTLNGQSYSVPGYTLLTQSTLNGAGQSIQDELTIQSYDGINMMGPIWDVTESGLDLIDPTGSSLMGRPLPTSFQQGSGYFTDLEFLVGSNGRGPETILTDLKIPISTSFSAVTPTPELPAALSLLVGLGLVAGWRWTRRGAPVPVRAAVAS